MSVNQTLLNREKRTIQFMLEIYCRGHHHSSGALCAECQPVFDHTLQRLEHCPYGQDKPACGRCPTHCYAPSVREQMRQVMRYAGPRMFLSHPGLALEHLVEALQRGRPTLPGPKGHR